MLGPSAYRWRSTWPCAAYQRVILDDNNVVSVGSRAICWAHRTLEIFDRLGVVEPMMDKGVTWKVGRLYHREREVYAFDLLPEAGHRFAAFINLQQYYVEEMLVARCEALADFVDLRFKNRVTGVDTDAADRVRVDVESPFGAYALDADYVVACDGARSFVREHLSLELVGDRFEERFLIADVRMKADFPSERWFWFEPPFHPGQSALLHKQPDNIYRIDLQLGPSADPAEEKKPEKVTPRIRKMIGHDDFELEWVSVYSFQCKRLERFVHGRVIFAGDSAHVVSPFGARGGNSGIQDIDNLGWRLAAIHDGMASADLLEGYDRERTYAAEDNMRITAATSRFMSPDPKAVWARRFREAVLNLAHTHAFARPLVNSGRLSKPTHLGPVVASAADNPLVGAPCPDVPLIGPNGEQAWLSRLLGGRLNLLAYGPSESVATAVASAADDRVGRVEVHPVDATETTWRDQAGYFAKRVGARRGDVLVIRPDRHVAAVLACPTFAQLEAAIAAVWDGGKSS